MNLLSNQPPRLVVPTGRDLLDRLLHSLSGVDLRGRGGAAFPTATKISSARGRRPILIINACDGEPLVSKDAVLLAAAPGLVADGAALVAQALDCPEVIIAAHVGSPTLSHGLALLLREADRLPSARVLPVPNRYVSSEASALVALARGNAGRPIFHDRPLSVGGNDGRSDAVLVLNAETVAQIAVAWSGRRRLSRLVTVTGAVGRPGVLEIEDDTTLDAVVERAGGATETPQALLLGGYGGTWLPWTAAACSVRDLGGHGIGTGAGLVYVLGRGCPLTAVAEVADYLAGESAGQCGPCTFGLPALAADWRLLLDPTTAAAARERLVRRLPVVEGRGACRHPDGAVNMLSSALRTFESHLVQHAAGYCDALQPAGAR